MLILYIGRVQIFVVVKKLYSLIVIIYNNGIKEIYLCICFDNWAQQFVNFLIFPYSLMMRSNLCEINHFYNI